MAQLNAVKQFQPVAVVIKAVFLENAGYRDRSVRFIPCERFAAICIDSGGDNRRLRPQCVQNLSGTFSVRERQGGDAVGADDLRERGKVIRESMPQADEVRDHKRDARQQHRGRAGQHDDSRQFSANGALRFEWHCDLLSCWRFIDDR